ncbi:hypothetical protein SEA_TOMAS_267 [Streptomyces phage Tomas]|uniref:Uncharacterized protein n=1 Tax=Streptomyces phage Tomas TaxID=2914443 RepID=A0AA49H080_9CAUD|nr:hypothetical protein PP453_gp011 [Streptomyces phage Tomas]YP_010651349.1 hypothetical protein PP453_gp057 [Streptomyces phage Tomas]UMO76202.1 hypothetical protein SEA_TOMAS_11 [Streptomyces phage Tomas]UMO76410.1 hypothetical protein SEA_TOMAS_267 [Streptomyces phage Tomas]
MKALEFAAIIAETPMSATVREELVRNITSKMTETMAFDFENIALGLADFEIEEK